ncbi:MAG: hypothetical protein EHM41_23200 [Chloroflexi bacterium]|nr:MAG: hypothetical protein EHM41_23200 [Chloroflexota bacterium]
MLHKLLFLLLIVLLIAGGACRSTDRSEVITQESTSESETVNNSQPAIKSPQPTSTQNDKATSPVPTKSSSTLMQDLTTQSLALRSVKMSLDTLYTDGKAAHIDVEIDSAGNYYLKKTFIGGLPEGYPQTVDSPPNSTELYVVDGIPYGPDQDGNIVKAEAVELASSLENLLLGVDGPGLWIKILPKGSLTVGGEEQRGGFQAKKYIVQSDIEGNQITGAIWVDQENQVLTGADLIVPGALLGSPDQPAENPLEIHFQVEKSEVSPITAGGSLIVQDNQSTGETSQNGTHEESEEMPVISNHYPLDPMTGGGLNLVAVHDQVWLLTRTGDLLIFDSGSGQEIDSIQLHPERTSEPNSMSIYLTGSIVFDGRYLWVLLSNNFMPDAPRELLRIDSESGEIFLVDLPAMDPTCLQSGCGWMALAISPGKLWVSGENTIWVFDVNDPSQVIKIEETSSTGYMAYDGKGKMWGSIQSHHGFLMAIDVDDLEEFHVVDCIGCSWVIPVEELIWAGVDSAPSKLLAYDAAAFPEVYDPIRIVDLENEVNGVLGGNRVFFDGRYIWDKTSIGDTLFYYDPQDGHLVGSLSIYTSEGDEWNPYDSVISIAFDGHEIWAAGGTNGNYELVRIHLPWVQ